MNGFVNGIVDMNQVLVQQQQVVQQQQGVVQGNLIAMCEYSELGFGISPSSRSLCLSGHGAKNWLSGGDMHCIRIVLHGHDQQPNCKRYTKQVVWKILLFTKIDNHLWKVKKKKILEKERERDRPSLLLHTLLGLFFFLTFPV